MKASPLTQTQTEADPRWAAVQAHDASARAAFVVGVVSTGIYCRPGCPARTPKPQNVRLFDGPAQARAAGLRACLRCRPDTP